MALNSTIHTVTVHLADVDRTVYEELELRVARHPSETAAYLVTRLLAYCLEYEEGIAFSDGGVSATDQPPVLVRDLTGRLTTWIDVGAPDAERIHRAGKLADRVAIYTHRDPAKVLAALPAKRIHRAETIPVYSLDREFVDAVAAAVDRRTEWTVSVTDRHLFLEIDGAPFSVEIVEHRLDG
ncbi:YaeQ family protein [Nocardia yunnanensis]|uniref:YaeQ family protein n=1 Tax=Nocardia yunnanensis TaxID=2382165 RepID=A0A386ZJW0_9NOCA|nr:YaeQ family protein [Nocardia yunnanensis]AYF77650.1 YaeQ family protein [Nocardia yunnanensis]